MAWRFVISGLPEAYLAHPVLGPLLVGCRVKLWQFERLENLRQSPGVHMFGAEHPVAAVQRVLSQGAGRLAVSQPEQGSG